LTREKASRGFSSPAPKAIAVLASGSGTILASIISRGPPVALVVTDRSCPALEVATAAGVPTTTVDRREFGYRAGAGEAWDRRGFTGAICEALTAGDIDLVAMAGFLTILHPMIFERYSGRIVNTHPSLLPSFKGAHAVQDTLAAGVLVTGPTIHVATEVLDDERHIIAQSPTVSVLASDDVDTLWERIKVEERRLYPQVLRDIVNGKLDLET
jgi:phosphoribosylglycinamide formyltransferase 1